MGKMNVMIPRPKQTYESISVSVLYHRLMTIIISSCTKVPDRQMYETILKLKTKDRTKTENGIQDDLRAK